MIRAAPLRRARPPSPSEHALQRSAAAYLRVAIAPPVYWSAVDAGAGKLTPAAAGNAKGRGVKAGLCDIFVFVPRDGLTLVIGIELKAGKTGRLSPVQVETHAALRAAGVHCHIARSVDEVEAILAHHGVPLRARSLPLRPRSGQALGTNNHAYRPGMEHE